MTMSRSSRRILIEDTRQQAGKHGEKHDWWQGNGFATVRCKLPFGDYALMYQVCVDTKRDIYELAMDIDQEHERFRREMQAARDAGCQLVVLVENTDGVQCLRDLPSWNESERHFAMRRKQSRNSNARKITGLRLAKACRTMEQRYGVRFEFCHPGHAAERVVEILGEGGR